MKKALIWFLATALMAAPAVSVLFVYLYFTLSDNCDNSFEGKIWEDPTSAAVYFSVAAAVVLSYAVFVVASPRPLRGTRWRYALGVPVAVTAGLADFLIVAYGTYALPLPPPCD